MALVIKHRLSDGTTVVTDSTDGAQFVVKAAEWTRIAGLPVADQRAAVEAAVLAARADPSGGRTEVDEQAMDQSSQGQGERHREGEK